MTRLIAHSALALLAIQPAFLMAAPDRDRDEDEYVGESPERYAMVRRVEGDVRIRKGDMDEALERGVPVGEGDVVESRGRGVLQLADGTRIGFAGATRFTVAALFKDEKGRRQVLLRLDHGRLRVAIGDESEAAVRVDCPSGSLESSGRSVFTIECERDRTARVKVYSGRADFLTNRDEAELRAGERVTVYSPEDRLDRIRSFNTYDGDEFERWADDSFTVRRSRSWDHVPSELRYYSSDLDDYGEWMDVPGYGWCWRPSGISVEWRPYWRGRWGSYGGGLTWISAEPWGYLTYHHGRWDWRAGFGWLWIPGLYYSPAWVAWNSWDSYCGWAPLGYYNYPATWGYGAWNGYHCWNVVQAHHLTAVNVNVHIRGERHLIAGVQGTGITTWNGQGLRPAATPWVRTPVILRPSEAGNTGQVLRAMRRDEAHTRLQAYDRQAQASTGRVILRQPGPPGSVSPLAADRAPVFRETETRTPRPGPTLTRPRGSEPARPAERPVDRPRGLPTRPDRPERIERIDRPRDTTPPDRPRDIDRPRDSGIDRRREFEPRQRERIEERRPEPPPRERPVERPRGEDRPRVEERRPEPPPRQDSRPAPPPRQESRPAPPPAPRPAPREERRGGR